jgi:hypothetical protein
MKNIIKIAALLLIVFPSLSWAGSKCYTMDEIRAEKLLRLHSELMVITVTCKQSSTGRDLVRAYTGFTKQNINQIKEAEKTMSSYYSANYGGDGISRLDTLRTKLANEIGQQIADVSAPTFCASKRDLVISMYDTPPLSLHDECTRAYSSTPLYEKPCDKSLKVTDISSQPKVGQGHDDIVMSLPKTKKKGKS